MIFFVFWLNNGLFTLKPGIAPASVSPLPR